LFVLLSLPVESNFKHEMNKLCILLIISLLAACKNATGPTKTPEKSAALLSDDDLMTLVEKQTFQYFWDGAEKTSGLACERIHLDGIYTDNDSTVVTSGGSGFGVMTILVGIERGFITRKEGFERLKKIVTWLEKADRFHGMFPHWWEGTTGKVKPFSQFDDGGDIVESAYLFQGLLCVRQYFQTGNEQEKALAARIDELWRDAEWDWYRGEQKENILFWHWSPNHAWKMNFRITGWNECLIPYILAAASPTHGVPAAVYHEGWAQNGAMVGGPTKYGHTLALKHNDSPEYGGPLFWSHYSFLGLDPRKLKDRYADYWEHNRNHTLINYEYCKENPRKFAGYGADCWGLTASYSTRFYAAHRPEEDFGVIAPTAALSSIVYTPKESLAAMRHFYEKHGDRLWGKYGFFDAFSEHVDWFPRRYLAIDQGPIVVMIENHRSALLWKLFMSCPEVQAGLQKLGFEEPYLLKEDRR
jgi:hypothetical protein